MSVTDTPFSLSRLTILVTGASSGIGRATAVACARMGAKVICTGRNEGRLVETVEMMPDDNKGEYIAADITDADGIAAIADAVPPLDGVVHCAGVGGRTFLRSLRSSDIERVMGVNFNAPALLQAALLKKKKIKAESSIVFMASRAPMAPTIGNGLYSASKGALIAYAKVLAIELAPRRIRVNCICPAMVWTEFTERDQALTGADYHKVEKQYPLGRFGQPDDVANLAVYLLSPASVWMTGSCLDITGGSLSM